MSTPNRQELVQNAVAFLADPKTQASPLTQRIQFLEAKGLTPQEIDIALKQAALSSPAPSYQTPYSGGYAPPVYSPTGMTVPHRWDWRDYFITAVLSGSVAYGAVALFKKYLLPHLQPPSATAYEEDRDALSAQFDAAEALLKEIQAESAAVRAAVEEQKDKIEKTTADVEAVVIEMREGEIKTRDEMREIRDEINNIREMLPKMIEKNKESQAQSLSELQQELKSLKALLLSRGPSSMPSSPMPTLGRPAIPAWQLASAPQNGVESSSTSLPPVVNTAPAVNVDKEKETGSTEALPS
ncbi:putative peroxisomal membrane anchor protein (Pex14p) conserved region [Lyophyllum shimeji]|uniref:Peroxisomal membrane protein PEX14 n=1 Tax=Lyophyllum shimeji TaxID=47721 RepID=A0A9P3UIY6_LYOSH|nr:putative peroxisomal membrane anchor protein (Pex14p) conserved region [Lyophyllum shimeji]